MNLQEDLWKVEDIQMDFIKQLKLKRELRFQRESKTLATITFQNYFRMYAKLSGMTGTALTEENEFREIYNLDVIVIPTNKPVQRIDQSRYGL